MNEPTHVREATGDGAYDAQGLWRDERGCISDLQGYLQKQYLTPSQILVLLVEFGSLRGVRRTEPVQTWLAPRAPALAALHRAMGRDAYDFNAFWLQDVEAWLVRRAADLWMQGTLP